MLRTERYVAFVGCYIPCMLYCCVILSPLRTKYAILGFAEVHGATFRPGSEGRGGNRKSLITMAYTTIYQTTKYFVPRYVSTQPPREELAPLFPKLSRRRAKARHDGLSTILCKLAVF